MDKITNVKALTTVIAYANEHEDAFSAEVIEKLENIKASYEKKSENRKPTKAQEKGAEVKADVLATINADPEKAFTASEILEAIKGNYETLTLPAVTAQLTALTKSCTINRFVEKKKAYFKAIGE